MTFDTRPRGPADLVPPALRAAFGERAGVDCLTASPFVANLGNLGDYGKADRTGEETCQALLQAKAAIIGARRTITAWAAHTDALITHHPEADCVST
jgi:hypothetical protein